MIESFNPATGEKLGEVPASTAADVAAAAAQARRAQRLWADLGAAGRNRILRRIPRVLIDRSAEIGRLVSAENGKPSCEAVGLTLPLCETVKLHTRTAERLESGVRVSPTFFIGSKARIFYEPLGLVGFILPWNFPFELGMKQLIPALAGGNAVIQKPSEHNPLIGELVKRLFEDAGVPPGLVQIVHGFAEVGEAVIDHSDAVCFVGSTRTGRKVAERAARNLVRAFLELGGNDPAIVRRDADLDYAARGLVNGTCFNAGQVCNGIERIYAHRDIVAPLTERIVHWAKQLRFPGEGAAYEIGPIKWPPQRAVYEEHVADALAKGATLVLGGHAVEKGGGLFWAPTVLTGMNHEMLMMREETFGPFLPIMSVTDDEEAMALANDSSYGLAASIWTEDVGVAHQLARRLKAGSVMINNAVQSGGCATLPFGGEGDSGVGRVQGEAAYFNYVAPKSLMSCPKSTRDLWMPYTERTETMVAGLARALYGGPVLQRLKGGLTFWRNRPRR